VNTSIRYRASRLAANTTTNCESPFSTSPSHLSATTTSATHGNILITLGKPSCLVSRSTLLQNTFVVSAGRTFFVSATVADTIHTIRKIVVYWYRLLPTDTQNQFLKIKKGSRSKPDVLPPTTSGARREGGAAVAVRTEKEPPLG
jgi:hypothetical protein